MANVIKPKRSNTASNVPTTANTTSGELAVNMADKKIYINNGTSIVQVGAGTLPALSGVSITSPSTNQVLQYNGTNWINGSAGSGTVTSISAGTGLSGGTITTTGTIALANTAVTAGSYTTANITIDAQGRITAASSGISGVSSVTGTAPIVSSGGSTPAISISQATTSTNGYLSSTDWNTFNNKTSNTGTVTSVAMTVPTGLSVSGTPITTNGTLAVTLTAGYSIPTTASQTNWDTAYSVRQQWTGGSTNLVAATGRTSLGGTTVGQNFFTLTNPTAITFPRINADNTVSALDAATFRTAIGAGTSSTTGTVTSVGGTGTVSGLSLSGTVTTTGNLTLGGTLSLTSGNVTTALGFTPYNATNPNSYIALASAITGYTAGTNTALVNTDTLLVALGKLQGQVTARGTGTVTGVTATAPVASSGGTAPVISMSAASAGVNGYMTGVYATKLDGIATGATANTGTVTSVGGTGTVSGLSLSGTVTTTGNLTLGGTLAVTASNFASQTANTFLSAPNGTAGVPTFRAVVAADIPTLNQNTTGTASNITGVLASSSLPVGTVLQTVSSFVGYVTTTSASYVDTGLTATITPKFATSKIFVLVNLNGITPLGGAWNFALTNNAGTILANLINYAGSLNLLSFGVSYLSSPATTSAYTYKIQYKISGTNTLRLNDYSSDVPNSTITLMEIAQ